MSETEVGQGNTDNQPLSQHETEMIQSAAAGDPSIIPQQFNGDVDKFIKSINDQRANMTRVSQENAELRAQVSNQEPIDKTELPEKLSIDDVEEVTGISLDDIQADFAQNNYQLSEEMRDRIKKEIPESMHGLVDRLEQLEAQSAQADLERAANLLGGADNVNRLFDWARQNLSQSERQDINQALSGSSWTVKEAVLNSLANRAGAIFEGPAESNEPNFNVSGATQTQGSSAGFSGVESMLEAMKDPRYGKDADYTRQVEQMVGKTDGVYRR